MERRKVLRVDVDLRCYVTTPKIGRAKLAAQVRDLSRGGISFVLDSATASWKPFSLGDSTTIQVVLPAEHDLGERCIHASGNVVRVDANGPGEARVAVSFRRADFRQLDKPADGLSLKLSSNFRM